MRSFDLISSDQYTSDTSNNKQTIDLEILLRNQKIFVINQKIIVPCAIFEQTRIIPREKYRGYYRVFHSNRLTRDSIIGAAKRPAPTVIGHRVKVS